MIKSIKHKGLKQLFYKGRTSGVAPDHIEKLQDILSLLDAAVVIEDINFVGSHLHQLSGDLAGTWSVRINGNWRVTFEFIDGDVYIVDYLDYH